MANADAQPESVAERLNLRCRQALRVAASSAPGAPAAFAARLRRESLELAQVGGARMAAFYVALARLIEGEPLDAAPVATSSASSASSQSVVGSSLNRSVG